MGQRTELGILSHFVNSMFVVLGRSVSVVDPPRVLRSVLGGVAARHQCRVVKKWQHRKSQHYSSECWLVDQPATILDIKYIVYASILHTMNPIVCYHHIRHIIFIFNL